MREDVRRKIVGSWAVGGVMLLLLEPALRLGIAAGRHIAAGLSTGQWCAFVAATAVMFYCEGYRGFSCSFCPRVVDRGFSLAHEGTTLRVAFAPFYAMSLFGDSRRRVATSWALALAIVVMIVAVRALPPTWRAIVDGAVAASLAWGVFVLGALWIRKLRRDQRAFA